MENATDKKFDLTDIDPPEDTLDDVLAIAAEVLAEYGEDVESQRTRIARMAQWLVLNVGGEPHQTEHGLYADRYRAHDAAHPLVRMGRVFAVERDAVEISGPAKSLDGKVCVVFAAGEEAARAFAIAVLRSCEGES